MEESVFLYSVNPRKVITGLSGGIPVRTSKSLFLTKEDVKICLQRGSVYRRFAAEGINERVTVGNIDRVHREKYISEEDWAAQVAKDMSAGHGKVDAPIQHEKKESNQVTEPEVKVIKEEAKKEPVIEVLKKTEPAKEESVAIEDSVESTDKEEAVLNETTNDEEVQTETAEMKEESVETPKYNNYQNNTNQKFKYNGKNKR